jgi:flavodoxin
VAERVDPNPRQNSFGHTLSKRAPSTTRTSLRLQNPRLASGQHAITAQQLPTEAQLLFREKKILIAYLSRTNNTKAIPEIIHQEVGGTLIALALERPYPDDYNAIVQHIVRENETGYLTPLKTKIGRVEQYDVVFLGFPTWGMQLPPPVRSVLHQYNLQGKIVIPFNTNAGYGVGTSLQTVRELCRQFIAADQANQ